MSRISKEDIFKASNQGLDIILELLPQAEPSSRYRNKKFKMRETEKTASSVLRFYDNIWWVKDFGGDRAMNAIDLYAEMNNKSFADAFKELAERFDLNPEKAKPVRAAFTKRQASDEEADGAYFFDFNEAFSENELKVIFANSVIKSRVTEDKVDWNYFRSILGRYSVRSLKSYSYVKERMFYTVGSTEDYPIFLFDYGDFKKAYQPKNQDKAYRFRYFGTKPANGVYGMGQIDLAYNNLLKESQEDNYDRLDEDGKEQSRKEVKLEDIILCSGDRDALNVAAMGYNPLWFDSETTIGKVVDGRFLTNLFKKAHNVYYLGDIDATGRSVAHKLCMNPDNAKYLDIKYIELPAELLTKTDMRGNPCKDVRDYLEKGWKPYDFKKLVENAMPYRFWDSEPRFNKNGDVKDWVYSINNVLLYNFLQRNGFARYKSLSEKDGYFFIQVVNNRVKKLNPADIRGFIHDFLKERQYDHKLRNAAFRSPALNDASLGNIHLKEIEFKTTYPDAQLFFFRNSTVKVSKEGIKVYRPAEIEVFAWEEQVIQHDYNFKAADTPFQCIASNGGYQVDILKKESIFLQYLERTSRMFWQKEEVDKVALTDEEKEIQGNHLSNKLFALGYMLHRFKESSKPWAVYAMDNKISDIDESHGGSGKSLFFKSLKFMSNMVTFDARNAKLTDNAHMYDRVNEQVDLIYFDDVSDKINFELFFGAITGSMVVNPKGAKQFEIEYSKSPKFCFTSNYAIRGMDPSKKRRLLFTVFSDYFHTAFEGYFDERTPKDEFGKNLFDDWTYEEWNDFYSTMLHTVMFYLNHTGKLNPPMENISKRQYLMTMGDNFKSWADVYFSTESGNLDIEVQRSNAFENYHETNKTYRLTPQNFYKKVDAWARFYGHTLNPPHVCNQGKRIIRKIEGTTYEYLFIESNPDAEKQEVIQEEDVKF
jgi:hypothetical protein